MIVVLGSTNTDMVISGKKIPVPGETVSGGRFMMNPGGKGANQAVAVARLSAKRKNCMFIAKVGDDVFGRDTATRMKKEGIEARLVVDRTCASGTALIIVDDKGQNCISVALGANGTLSPAEPIFFLRKSIDISEPQDATSPGRSIHAPRSRPWTRLRPATRSTGRSLLRSQKADRWTTPWRLRRRPLRFPSRAPAPRLLFRTGRR
jgi:hypothetical protein